VAEPSATEIATQLAGTNRHKEQQGNAQRGDSASNSSTLGDWTARGGTVESAFRVRCFQPLSHLSGVFAKLSSAERGGSIARGGVRSQAPGQHADLGERRVRRASAVDGLGLDRSDDEPYRTRSRAGQKSRRVPRLRPARRIPISSRTAKKPAPRASTVARRAGLEHEDEERCSQ
jgi:hypothetical protein